MSLSDDKLVLTNRVLLGISACIPLVMLAVLSTEHISKPLGEGEQWFFFELSRNIFTDFYHVKEVTQFQVVSEYYMGLAPLLPALIAIFNLVFDQGVYGGLFINCFASAMTFFMLIKISSLLFQDKFYGILIYFLLISRRPYWFEISTGLTYPVFILIVVTLLYLIINVNNDGFSYKHTALIGVMSGLATMQRFDFLLAGMIVGIVMFTQNIKFNIREFKFSSLNFSKSITYYVFYFITISPWIIHSYVRFGKFFTSDNSASVFSVGFIHPLSFISEPYLTIFDAPFQWLDLMLRRIHFVCISTVSELSMITIPFFIIFLCAILYSLYNGLQIMELSDKSKQHLIKLLKYGLVLGGQFTAIALSGLYYPKYLNSIVLFWTIFLIFIAFHLFHNSLKKLIKPFLAVIIIIGGIGFTYKHGKNIKSIEYDPGTFEIREPLKSIVSCLYNNINVNTDKVYWDRHDWFKTAALTDLRLSRTIWPEETPEIMPLVFKKFGIQYIVMEDQSKFFHLFKKITYVQLCNLPVYKIEEESSISPIRY